MADRSFTDARLLKTHISIEFNLGQSRSGPNNMSVTIPVENAHALTARLLALLNEYAQGGHSLPPLSLGNGQEIVLGNSVAK